MTSPVRDVDEAEQLLITVGEAARRLSIGRSHIYAQMQRGRLRSVRIGRSRRILERDLDHFIEDLLDDHRRIVSGRESRPTSKPVKGIPLRAGRR